ncbi:uncharacterized protein LOC132744115 [Ruditapes philippinarum]|uniref:uncharacterized protein LOC132744115 n=1 Tax=Ruditapes philippinarum TaxID=129788 RepID=UPI00295BBA78|nr:uncharacterized protein LOC132744115 [Ruditapes philippinarum]
MNIQVKYFAYVFCIYINVLFVGVYGTSSTSSDSKSCNIRNAEITCNYIPADIPVGTRTVSLINILERTLSKGLFSTYNWRQITKLEISASKEWLDEHDTVAVFDSLCFSGLNNLEVLHIQLETTIIIAPDSFIGIENLKRLDLSGCRRLNLEDVLNAIDNNNVIPKLQYLNLAFLASYHAGITLSERFFKLIADKKVRELDIGSTQIKFLNLTAFITYCAHLKRLNISSVRVNEYKNDLKLLQRPCPNLESIDASYAVVPSQVSPVDNRVFERNENLPINFYWMKSLRFIQSVSNLSLAGILSKQSSFSFYNITVYVFGVNRFKLEVINLGNNNFNRMDLKLNIPGCTFKKVYLSGCNIHYLHPDAISSFILLSDIDLSRNKLNSMMAEDFNLFENMFKNLSNLRSVRLASNGLTRLPKYIFAYNLRLEFIDISDNQITEFSCEVIHLKSLRTVDVRRNRIQVIDAVTFDTFDKLNVYLLLRGNFIQCSKCNSLAFVKWLKNSASITTYNLGLQCDNKDSKKIFITDNTINEIQEICNRPKVIIVICCASVLALISVVAILFKIRRCQRQRKYQREMEDRIALIREGADENKFVVFLSYSSNDDDFVSRYVFNQLNENLQQTVGKDSNLVCEGDKHFQIGRPIPEQMSKFLRKSSVVVILLTDHYIQSAHCRNEFDHAILLEKPIVLMVKDEIDIEMMNGQMLDLYEHRTRILFMKENDDYIPKTSWENVCTSIIELVEN